MVARADDCPHPQPLSRDVGEGSGRRGAPKLRAGIPLSHCEGEEVGRERARHDAEVVDYSRAESKHNCIQEV